MRTSVRGHIAQSLLAVLLLGTVVVPFIHQFSHVSLHLTTEIDGAAGADTPAMHSDVDGEAVDCALCLLHSARGPFVVDLPAVVSPAESSARVYLPSPYLDASPLYRAPRGRAPPAA